MLDVRTRATTPANALIGAEMQAYLLLERMHRESNCGRPTHWSECVRLCQAHGWSDWESWRACVSGAVESFTTEEADLPD